MNAVHRTEELAFARMLLAAPTAQNRAVYADWLETEVGDTERAVLIRRTEQLEDHDRGMIFYDSAQGEGWESWHFSFDFDFQAVDCVVFVLPWYQRDHSEDWLPFLVRADGTSPDNPHNWAWLLSLALDRGLVIPGLPLSPPPVPVPPDRTPRAASRPERAGSH